MAEDKPESQNFNGGFSISNFGMGLRGGLATLTEGFGGGGENVPSSERGLGNGGLGTGGFGGTGFQEPLPLPEMREEETQNTKKKPSFMAMAKVAGKMKKSLGKIRIRKNQQQDLSGMALGDGGDDSEGGMGLLG
jgi:hypothetical protein